MPRKAQISAAMVGLMGGGERHAWTLEELHEGLARRGRVTDFSSVFRAAEKLSAGGVARKVQVEDGRTRFELVPVPCVIGHEDFAALERATGAAILDHHLVLSGLCRNCRTAPSERHGAR